MCANFENKPLMGRRVEKDIHNHDMVNLLPLFIYIIMFNNFEW